MLVRSRLGGTRRALAAGVECAKSECTGYSATVLRDSCADQIQTILESIESFDVSSLLSQFRLPSGGFPVAQARLR